MPHLLHCQRTTDGVLVEQFALTEACYTVARLAQTFEKIESRDAESWTENLGVVCVVDHAVKVSLILA